MNLLTMHVTAVIPHVNLGEIDASIEALARASDGMLPGTAAQQELTATVTRLRAQREAVRLSAERDMIHVSFVDDDSGSVPVGNANFLVPSGIFEEGRSYRLTAEEVAP